MGCTDPTAFNYNPLSEVDNGSCIPTVMGCLDDTADNFNPSANTSDGSCQWRDVINMVHKITIL